MTGLDDILAQLPLDKIAAQFGIDPDTARQAAESAGGAILGGLNANAQDPNEADAIAQALQKHDASMIDGGVDLDSVDVGDGDKILDHVFGDNKAQVVNQLGGSAQNLGGVDMGKLMAMLAPVVMSFLTKQMAGGGAQQSAGGGIGDLLGGLLGGGSGGGLGGLDDLLGGLLGKK